MKNKFLALIIASMLLSAVLGCKYFNSASSNSNTNKTLVEQGIDKTVGEEKIGIPECDEAFNALTKSSENKDDNFITKGAKQVFLNKMRENLKDSIEKNKKDKAQQAKECREYKTQIDNYNSKEESNKK
jgi:hypothetical protein